MTDRIIAMTSSNDTDASKKPLKLSRPKLELKKTVDAGQVRQSFPHGRTKTVAVEVKRKRTYARGNGDKVTEVTTEPELVAPADGHGHAPAVAEAPAAAAHHLTEGERAVRLRALGEAKRDDEVRRQVEVEAARQRAEEEARRAAEEAARPKSAPAPEPEIVAAVAAEAPAPVAAKAKPAPEREVEAKPHRLTAKPAAAMPMADEEESDRARRPGAVRHAVPKPAPVARRDEPRRRTGKITISQALDEDAGERVRSLAAVRRAREKERRLAMAAGESAKVIRDVVIPETITVQELANRMAERGADVIKALMKMGIMATINQTLDADTAELVAGEFGHRVRRVSAADVEIGVEGLADEAAHMAPRWPVVTVMGHVDHGKTSLLDALRQTDVAAHEAGGITQHIGAYQVTRANGQKITFIDTPGHAAFTEMRARGANVTDIVVLVVAADDGIMEQTVEAIHHAKAAKVPIIVAINKIDKPEANPTRVRQELLKHELVVEELGGDIQTVEVSAKTKQGLDKLEEAILLQAEILELKANPDRPATGAVIEAKLERGRGVVATLLVQRGTLRVGDILVAGGEWGRVRALLNDRGDTMNEAGPSTPAEILGLQGAPLAGDTFSAVENETKARQVSEYRQRVQRDKEAATRVRGSAQDIFAKIAEGEAKELPVIVKGDVQGSIEAIVASLQGLSTKEVAVRVLHTAVGGINESDVTLARASNAMIIGFNVRTNPQAREMAKRDKIEIRYYSIIYNVVDDVKAALSGLLSPTLRENFLGYATIREVFNITKVGKVAGCMVTEGVVKRGAKVRLLRDNVVIHEGSLKTLKRFKDEVREVKEGFECGMAFENYDNIQVGDQIECFEIEQVTRTLA